MQGIFLLTKKLIRKIIRNFIFIFSIPFSLLIVFIFPFYKIKFVALVSDRIGHYAMNTELLLCYLDEIKKKDKTDKKVKYIFYTRLAPICNNQLHHMWKKIIPIFPWTRLAAATDNILLTLSGERYKNPTLRRYEIAQGCQDINAYFQQRPSRLHFTQDELFHAKKLLLKLGIPQGQKYICLMVRDSAYLDQYLPNNDWSYHFYRDCDIKNFEKVALYLVEKGYFIFRMGKIVAQPLDVKHPHIVDYANHPLRSDFLDIYLSAHCEFFISTATGLDAIPQIFRQPVVLVNIAPFKQQLQYWYPCEFFITKKVYDNNNQRFLSYQEIDAMITPESDVKKIFAQYHYTVVENTPDEILHVVSEMEDFISKKQMNTTENFFIPMLKTQKKFSMIADRELLHRHPEKFYIRMGKKFREENMFLFTE